MSPAFDHSGERGYGREGVPPFTPYDRLRQRIIEALEDYEESQRRYLDKVEPDRPATAREHWDAVWEFRKTMSVALDTLTEKLHQSRFAKDR